MFIVFIFSFNARRESFVNAQNRFCGSFHPADRPTKPAQTFLDPLRFMALVSAY